MVQVVKHSLNFIRMHITQQFAFPKLGLRVQPLDGEQAGQGNRL